MGPQQPLLWTLADYERLLAHPSSDVRFWAKQHIATEYPEQAPQILVRLLNDRDELLQHSAIEALGSLAEPDSEERLLALLPQVDENNQGWITTYLGRRQSAQILPSLLQEVASLDLTQPKAERDFRDFSRIAALGEYTDPRATALLWQLVDGYGWDSRFQETVYNALLRHLDAMRLPRLLERLIQLKKVNEQEHASAWHAIAAAVGLERMLGEVSAEDEFAEFLEESEAWWGLAPFTPELRQTIGEHYQQADLFSILVSAFQQEAAARNEPLDEWLAAWQAGSEPVGYRRRTLAGWQLLTTCARLTFPTDIPHHALLARDLGILILGQYLLDEDDEKRLAITANAEERRTALLAILNSPRQNVYATVVEEVVALGPSVAPDLMPILAADTYWPLERALNVVRDVTRAHPGAADTLIPTLIDLLSRDVGDFVNEACANAMRAVGPAIVKPLAAAFTSENSTLEIYGIGVLSDIPVQAAVDAIEAYITEQGEIDAFQWESLLQLGQRQSIKFLRQFYDGRNPRLAHTMHTIGLLHGLNNEEMDAWAAVVKADAEVREQSTFDFHSLRRGLDFTMAQPLLTPTTAQNKRDDAARKARKKKRNQAKATKKAQQKTKKKKR